MLMSPLSKCFFLETVPLFRLSARSVANHVLETTEDLGLSQTWKMVLKIESHSTAMGLLSCIALLMGFTTGVPGDSCSQMT